MALVTAARTIRPYIGPGWLVQYAENGRYFDDDLAQLNSGAEYEIVDRHIRGWEPYNAVLRGADGSFLLARLMEGADNTGSAGHVGVQGVHSVRLDVVAFNVHLGDDASDNTVVLYLPQTQAWYCEEHSWWSGLSARTCAHISEVMDEHGDAPVALGSVG